MRARRRLLAALGLVGFVLAAPSAGATPPPLSEVQVIPLPGVERRIDHFAVDPAGKRLFVAALGNGTLEVLDIGAGKRADNLRYDAAAGQLYLGYGEGALGVIEPSSLKLVASIPVGGHPESFRLEETGPRVFVNVPATGEVLVVDRRQRSTVMHIPLGGPSNNYPMSLDESGHRLFVGVRRPAQLLVFDTLSGKRLAAVPCVGDTDDLFYDARRDRVYVIGGEGYVDVFDAAASGKYDRLARIATRAGARTGLWSGELDRLFVAWPSRGGHPAEIHVLGAPGGT